MNAAPIQYFAHSRADRPPSDWEPLLDHLENVARRAEQFAGKFGVGTWGRQLGLWHDLGKYNSRFQHYLREANGYEIHLEEKPQVAEKVPHAAAGAKYAIQELHGKRAVEGWLLAYAIAGHHAGLPDGVNDQRSCLRDQIQRTDISWEGAPAELLMPLPLETPKLSFDSEQSKRAAFQLALFGRMLFSCLVDADFLATERFLDLWKSQQREAVAMSLADLLGPLNEHLNQLAGKSTTTNVHACRQGILKACRTAAELWPGLFALAVPTGGGKTLASLAFALEHARRHPKIGFERVIYAIPFTSIIEQTAAIFRSVFDALGPDIVLEHHSNLDPDEERTTPRSRLAAENWDAPLVVTTNVQLFESLFAARPSKCRKLHRLVKSILILDEVQTLPVELLQPCLAVLRELAADYQCTVVLCTATQPAFDHREKFKIGLEKIRPIIPARGTEDLYDKMRRTEVVHLGILADAELAGHLRKHEQFLCIVNTRKHAALLYELLRAEYGDPREAGLFHLSTWMCGAHRSQVIQVIKERLAAGLSCRVVSTSLIEAGVDVDFPVVFRAMAGVDAIAQAAGRCNREGKVDRRTVFVFEPAEAGASHFVQSTIASTRELLPEYPDLLSLQAVHSYFKLHFWKHSDRWDAKSIMGCFTDLTCQTFEYRAAAERFRMIEDHERPIIVAWGDMGRELVGQLRNARPADCWRIARKLQRYTVNVPRGCFDKMLHADLALIREDEFGDRFPVLSNLSVYDDERGLNLEKMGRYDPSCLVS
jgi:CRISPR-associated endonuclease/helicase Cas3